MTEAQIDDTHPYDDDDVSAPSARYGNEPYSASSSLQMLGEFDGILLDYSRQQATLETKKKLFKLAEVASLKQKINQMYNGEHINNIDNRSVLHVALRAPRDVVTLFVHTALQTDPEAIESTRGRQLRLQ